MLPILITVISISLIGCGQVEEDSLVAKVDVETDINLQDYVNLFLEECDMRGIECSTNYSKITEISFATQESMDKQSEIENTAGLCVYNRNGSREVYISERFKDSRLAVKYLMFHELGHCILDLDHVEGKIAIMNAQSDFYEISRNFGHWSEWVDELFKEAQN